MKTLMWYELQETDLNAFSRGSKAWDAYYKSRWRKQGSNPYKRNTVQWYSWNIGYNTNQAGI